MRGRVIRRIERGFSLVEVLVAIAILSIATLGLFTVFDQSGKALAGSRDRLLAEVIARNRAEELRLGLRGLPESVTAAGQVFAIETDRRATSGGFEEQRVRVVAPGGAAAVLTVYTAPGGQP